MLSVLYGLCFLDVFHSLPTEFSKLWRKGEAIIDEDLPFRTECSKTSHSLFIFQLWVFVFAHIYWQRKILWCDWARCLPMNHAYSITLLGFILFLLSFNRTVVFVFLLGLRPTQSHVLGSSNVRYEFFFFLSWTGLYTPSDIACLLTWSLWLYCSTYLAGRLPL